MNLRVDAVICVQTYTINVIQPIIFKGMRNSRCNTVDCSTSHSVSLPSWSCSSLHSVCVVCKRTFGHSVETIIHDGNVLLAVCTG